MSPEAEQRAEKEFGYVPTYPEAVQQAMHPHEEQQQQQALSGADVDPTGE